MQATMEPTAVPKSAIWAGRSITALIVVFLIFDGVTKVMKTQQVIEATVRIGFPESSIVGIGAALLVCTAVYLIPQTSVLGAILLTGYLGGATAANVRAATGAFNTSFPVIFAVLVWLGLYLRERRLWVLVPLRRG
jgi:hypothetical protein